MKTRDKTIQQDVRGGKDNKEGKPISHNSKRLASAAAANAARAAAEAQERAKRSGLDAVKLHLQVTGGTGRTSRSATAVRKTSVRMTAIKEYPFDLSDLQNQKSEETQQQSVSVPSPDTLSELPNPPALRSRPSIVAHPTPDGKRKVSIMADESSKDRENLPSERGRLFIYGSVDMQSRDI